MRKLIILYYIILLLIIMMIIMMIRWGAVGYDYEGEQGERHQESIRVLAARARHAD